jgi:uncharacterized protein YqhQ
MTKPTPADAASSAPLRLGGMALRNGLLIHGPTYWAAAVRRPDGEIEVASGQKPVLAKGAASRLPGLRGVLKLAEAFAVIPIVRSRLPAARLPFEDVKVLGAMIGAAAAGSALRRRRTTGGEAAIAALGMLPAVIALRGSELAEYHGVEHKAIGAYEQGAEPETAAKEHERCGSNLVAPMLASTIVGQAVVRRLLAQPGILAQGAVSVGSVAVAVELFGWSERHAGSPLADAFHKPGTELQKLFATREPSAEQLEVGKAALDEILRVEPEQDPASRKRSAGLVEDGQG